MYDISKYYKNYEYPNCFKDFINLELKNFEYWYLYPDDGFEIRINGLKQRYPERKLIPFARRDDNDDIACLEVGQGEKVFIIHDFASPGWEKRKEYDNVWLWLRDAINELVVNKLNEFET